MNLRPELDRLQDGCCGICGRRCDSLVVDHDHTSGFIRGLLCASCNGFEGRHPECSDPWDWERCSVCRWRAQPAVCWLGRTERYRHPWYGATPDMGAGERLTRPWTPTHHRRDEADEARAADHAAAARLGAELD